MVAGGNDKLAGRHCKQAELTPDAFIGPESGLDRMDSVLFALMILSRTARSAAAFGGLRSLTRL